MNTTTNTAAIANDNRSASSVKAIHVTEIKDRDHKHHGRSVAGEVLEGATATIVPGKCITLSGVDFGHRGSDEPFFNHFRIGDAAKVGGWNLDYTGVVRAITAKTVTVVEYEGHNCERRYVLSIYRFARLNRHFDAEVSAERNSDQLQCI